MSFLRPITVRTIKLTVALTVACAMTLVAVAPAQAELGPTPGLETDALSALPLPARALPAVPTVDAAHFCPRPTGRWWDDLTVRGCIELLTGRDHTRPLTMTELSWLDFGDLPPYATVDVDAIDAAIAAYEQHLADEAAAAAQAARDAATAAKPRPVAQPTRRELPGQPYSDATIDRVLTECGYHDTTPRSYEEQLHHGERTTACIESRMPGYWDWVMDAERRLFGIEPDPEQEAYNACLEQLGSTDDIIDRAATRAYVDAHARCVDRRVPGYYARWASQEAKREAELEKALARDAAAYARLLERQERARQEIRDTCPHGGIASPTKSWASSYDEVDYVVTCFDGPTG